MKEDNLEKPVTLQGDANGDCGNTKLSHKQRKALFRKEKRKVKRQALAKERELYEELEKEAEELHPDFWPEDERTIELEEEESEQQRLREHELWLQREEQAKVEWEARTIWLEKEKIRREQEEKRIREEWEEKERKAKEEEEKLKEDENEKKLKQEALLRDARSKENKGDGPWHNPMAPVAVPGREAEKCPFFAKVGACRYGQRCSRVHVHPDTSVTVLINNMYTHFGMDKQIIDEHDTDLGLEVDEREAEQHFRQFYYDVLPELQSMGKVLQFKVCNNAESHLRGNVYVQYSRQSEAESMMSRFNGRWYAGKQINCEFVTIPSWKNALCGLAGRKRCPKGESCNFLHAFHNPGYEFRGADNDDFRSDSQRNSNRYGRHQPWHSHRQRSARHRSRSPTYSRRSRSRSISPSSSYVSRHRSRRRSRSRSRRSRMRSRSPSRRSKRSPSPRSTRRSLLLSPQRRSRSRSPRHPRSSRRHEPRKRSHIRYRSPSTPRSSGASRSRSRSPVKRLSKYTTSNLRTASRSRSKSPPLKQLHSSSSSKSLSSYDVHTYSPNNASLLPENSPPRSPPNHSSADKQLETISKNSSPCGGVDMNYDPCEQSYDVSREVKSKQYMNRNSQWDKDTDNDTHNRHHAHVIAEPQSQNEDADNVTHTSQENQSRNGMDCQSKETDKMSHLCSDEKQSSNERRCLSKETEELTQSSNEIDCQDTDELTQPRHGNQSSSENYCETKDIDELTQCSHENQSTNEVDYENKDTDKLTHRVDCQGKETTNVNQDSHGSQSADENHSKKRSHKHSKHKDKKHKAKHKKKKKHKYVDEFSDNAK